MKEYINIKVQNYEIYFHTSFYVDKEESETILSGYINYIGKQKYNKRQGNKFIYDYSGVRFDFPYNVPQYIINKLDILYKQFC